MAEVHGGCKHKHLLFWWSCIWSIVNSFLFVKMIRSHCCHTARCLAAILKPHALILIREQLNFLELQSKFIFCYLPDCFTIDAGLTSDSSHGFRSIRFLMILRCLDGVFSSFFWTVAFISKLFEPLNCYRYISINTEQPNNFVLTFSLIK